MFDHVTIRVSDRAASERFYATVLRTLGVDAFWRAGVDAGYRDDGAPGPRPEYGPDYYGGFLLDPDGNNVEVVNHHRGQRALRGARVGRRPVDRDRVADDPADRQRSPVVRRW